MSAGDPRPDSLPDTGDDDRSDIAQIVEARKDAVERGEGGREPDSFTSAGIPDGVGGTGGVVKKRNDAQ